MRFLDLLPLALTATAFLIPAEIEHDVGIMGKLPSTAKSEKVVLECVGGCPVALASKAHNGVPILWTEAYSGKLVADITVKDDKVLFNGRQIWPQTLTPPLSMSQVTEDDTYEPFKGQMPVSTAIEYKEAVILLDSTQQITLHPIVIDILAVVDQVVHTETVEVNVAETKDGVGLLPSKIRAYEPSPYTDNCTTVWCRVKGTIAKKFNEWRDAASNKIKGWRKCGQKQGGHKGHRLPHKGGPAKFGAGSSLDPNRHHGKNGNGHQGHHHGRVHNAIARFAEFFVFPVLFGLGIGLIFGSISLALVKVLRNFRTGSQAEYIVVEAIDAEEGLALPPKYEEVYREPQVETEDEKKQLLQ